MIKMIDLPYPINSLEPYYDRQTLAIHYDTLYRGYVNNTNKVLEKLETARVKNDFESFEKFKNQFSESSKVVEGSGWNLLVWDKRLEKLVILQCEKHQNLTLWNSQVLLVLDMWEHSYFLQYKAQREKYIGAFWNIVNWNEVNKRFEEI